MAADSTSTGAGEADACAVAHVLAASDYYACLGAPHNASTQDLRRCYLRASVRVHPDKNRHPDATKAFQKVAMAWETLSDEASRHRYDAELASNSKDEPFQGDAQNKSEEVSAEAAFLAFARAAAACASVRGGAMGEFADVLLCAQALARLREEGITSSNVGALSAGGFVLASGLSQAGAVAKAAGLKDAGVAAERAANALKCATQVAMVGAAVAQIPAVQDALESGRAATVNGVNKLGEAVGDAKKAVGGAVDDAKRVVLDHTQNISVGEAANNIGAKLGGMATWARQASQNLAGKVAEVVQSTEKDRTVATKPHDLTDSQSAHLCDDLPVGTLVKLDGLQSSPHLNGTLAEVLGIDPETSRYRIRLIPTEPATEPVDTHAAEPTPGIPSNTKSGDIKRIKREHLRPISQ